MKRNSPSAFVSMFFEAIDIVEGFFTGRVQTGAYFLQPVQSYLPQYVTIMTRMTTLHGIPPLQIAVMSDGAPVEGGGQNVHHHA